MHEGEDNTKTASDAGCRVFDVELAAYLEGEERPALSAHVRDCPYCYAILSDLEGIRSSSSDLATEEPPPRLWSNIRASLIAEGIIRQPQTFWQRWLQGWSASVGLQNGLAVATLGFLMVLGIGLLKAPRPETASHKASSIDLSEVASAAMALGSMEMSYQARAASLDPSMKETYQKSLDSLDGEIRECLDSIQQQPDNLLAREYLLAAYEQKATVLQSALYVEGR
jgi:hypothetical protein